MTRHSPSRSGRTAREHVPNRKAALVLTLDPTRVLLLSRMLEQPVGHDLRRAGNLSRDVDTVAPFADTTPSIHTARLHPDTESGQLAAS